MSNFSNASILGQKLTSPPPLFDFSQLVTWCTIYILISLVAIVGNVLIIFIFSQKRRLRTRTNYFIIGLATSDVIVGAVTIPLWMAVIVFLQMQQYKEMNIVYDIFRPLDILSGMLSILHLMTISLERLYAIALPLHHRISRARTNCMILAAIWAFAAGVASLSFIIPKGPKWKGTFIVYSVLGFFVPFFFILVAYMSIYIIVKKRSYASRNHTRAVRKESRTAFTIFVLVLLFSVTWLPFFSLNLVLFACQKCSQTIYNHYNIILFFKALHYSGSALNPIIYSARMPEFRRPLKTLIKERRISESTYSYRKDSAVSLRSMRGRKLSDFQSNS